MENSNLEAWFSERPIWIQTAAAKLITEGELGENDIKELVALCKSDAGIEIPNPPESQSIPVGSLSVEEATENLCIDELRDISGINALKPTKPLKFSKNGLTVVFGGNGSGKSGYVRLLKHACDVRNPGGLLNNVFKEGEDSQECMIAATIGEDEKKFHWKKDTGPINELRSIDIYDSKCGLVYLTQESEVAYEPWVLRLFSELTRACDQVSQAIFDEMQKMPTRKPVVLPELSDSEHGKWYSLLSANTTDEEVSNRSAWTGDDEKKHAELKARLAEAEPAEKAKQLLKRKSSLDSFIQDLESHAECLSSEACQAFVAAKLDAEKKRKAANEDAAKVFSNTPLDGVGSDTWRELWNAARKYSKKEAYKDIPFPNAQDDARCVLCQQLLADEAKTRFLSFEEFVRGELEKSAADAVKQVVELEKTFTEAPDMENCGLLLNAAHVEDEEVRKNVVVFCTALRVRRAALLDENEEKMELPGFPQSELLGGLKNSAKDLEKKAGDLEKDAIGQNRAGLSKDFKELECKKWFSANNEAIIEEVKRLRDIAALDEAKRRASTNSGTLSTKKSKLAEGLITTAYVERFKEELRQLGASKVAVSLEKTRAEKGQVYHRISLRGCCKEASTTDVLSEGEFRIVSLAAFLADVTGRNCATPFIFDDPISSLDQEYEEATVKRLVSLADTRQVIVFTHRLSLLSQLQEEAKNENVDCTPVGLWSAYGVIGEPGETPMFAKRPDKAINGLLNERLSKAKKIKDKDGPEQYEAYAKGICLDVRVVVESIVEKILFADVVKRFRREVQTKNKIQLLAKINSEDCKFIDDLMTKYSGFKHSQPEETPVAIPGPDELEEDLQNIASWLDEFSKREVPSTAT